MQGFRVFCAFHSYHIFLLLSLPPPPNPQANSLQPKPLQPLQDTASVFPNARDYTPGYAKFEAKAAE